MRNLAILFLLIGSIALVGCSGNGSTDSGPPRPPSNLSAWPLSSSSVELQWTDNSNNEDAFDIYRSQYGSFGRMGNTGSNQTSYVDNNLAESTDYRYYVVAVNASGNSAPSDTVSVATRSVGEPPSNPSNPSPAHQAVNQGIEMNLIWRCSDPDQDSLMYDIYFGANPTPALLAPDCTKNSYPTGELSYNTTYYWKIVAKDNHRHSTDGPLWHFTTGAWSLSLVGECGTPGSNARRIFAIGDYAYVADLQYLTIIDATSPAQPSVAASVDGGGNIYFMDIWVAGNRAYAATWTPWYNHNDDGGYAIYDISNPRNPTYVASAGAASTGQGITVIGDYAYVATQDSGFAVFDITNPWNRVARCFRGYGYEDIYGSGDYVYVTNGVSLEIFNISNPISPAYVSVCGISPIGEANAVFISGQYAFVTEWFQGLHVVDISNPAAPYEVGLFYDGGQAWDVYVTGEYAYLVDNQSLMVIDITQLTNPMLLARYQNIGGAWGVFAEGDYIYVANLYAGVRIFRFSS